MDVIPYNQVFWRSRCARASWGDRILQACRENCYDHVSRQVGSMICSIVNTTYYLLDGTCEFRGGWGGGAKGVFIRGVKVERLVCDLLAVEQPPLRPRERAIPSLDELRSEVRAQREAAARGELKRPPTWDELGLPQSLVIVRSRQA